MKSFIECQIEARKLLETNLVVRTYELECQVAHLLKLDSIRKQVNIVTLCGSTRFKKEFHEENLNYTLMGYVVLSVGSFMHSDTEIKITPEQKQKLDELHKRKIDMSDFIYVIDVDGYIGESTRSEIEYATVIAGIPVLYRSKNERIP